MNSPSLHLPALLAGLLSVADALAQTQLPVRPPPWWAVPDEVTLSLYWDFSGGPASPPSFVVASPLWYNPLVTGPTFSANIVGIPALAGHSGCVGMLGTGAPQTGLFTMTADNDPHLNWVKIFWFQFDVFEGATGDIKSAIKQDLARYSRAIVAETSEPIGQGWERVTISAELIPQPDEEGMEWTFFESALGTVAIDNLFVNSKCVKPGPDKDGTALGVVDGAPIDLTALFPGVDCVSVAVTEGPGPAFLPTYWVGSRATPPAQHQVLRFGTVPGSTPLPAAVAQSPFGVSGLTVETVVTSTTTQQFVYALVDNRPAVPGVKLYAIDTNGVLVPARDVTLAGFPPIAVVPQQDFGLTFDPSGNLGAGTFWVSDQAGLAYEFDRAGAIVPGSPHPIPPGCSGLGYDDTLGYFYGFSRAPRPTPLGIVQVNGFEWSGYDFQPTGVEFCGDIRIPNPGGSPGGIASSIEVYRPKGNPTSELRMVCIVDVPGQNRRLLYVLAGPYRFGWSQLGRCGMAGGAPFVGSPSFQVTLTGVPNSLGAVLYIGFSNQVYLGVPLPIPLAGIGWPESFVSISPDLSTGLLAPTTPGSFAFPLNLPPGIGLSYTPLFFQWVVLDTQVPGFLAATQAGKTIAY